MRILRLWVCRAAAFPFWRPEDDLTVDTGDSLSRLRCMMSRILTGDCQLPAHVSPSCASLIRGMLTVDPLQRMTIADIMAHPWFRRDLPADCFAVNEQLLAMPEHRRTAYCRQTDADILRVIGSACGIL